MRSAGQAEHGEGTYEDGPAHTTRFGSPAARGTNLQRHAQVAAANQAAPGGKAARLAGLGRFLQPEGVTHTPGEPLHPCATRDFTTL
jgi:hypothetical protein